MLFFVFALQGYCQEWEKAASSPLSPRRVIEVGAPMEIERVAMSANADVIAVVGYGKQGELMLYDTRTGKSLRTIHPPMQRISAIDFSDDGSIVATAGSGGAVSLWRVADGEKLAESTEYVNYRITEMVLLDNPSRVVCATNAFETFIMPQDSMVLENPLQGGVFLSVYADEARLANVYCEPFNHGAGPQERNSTILLYDIKERQEIGSIETGVCRSLRVDPSGRYLAAAVHAGAILVYDMQSLALLAKLHARTQVFGDAFFTDDNHVLAAGSACRLYEWRLPEGTPVRMWRLNLEDKTTNISVVRGASAYHPGETHPGRRRPAGAGVPVRHSRRDGTPRTGGNAGRIAVQVFKRLLQFDGPVRIVQEGFPGLVLGRAHPDRDDRRALGALRRPDEVHAGLVGGAPAFFHVA